MALPNPEQPAVPADIVGGAVSINGDWQNELPPSSGFPPAIPSSAAYRTQIEAQLPNLDPVSTAFKKLVHGVFAFVKRK